jgi:hypothetical protein
MRSHLAHALASRASLLGQFEDGDKQVKYNSLDTIVHDV